MTTTTSKFSSTVAKKEVLRHFSGVVTLAQLDRLWPTLLASHHERARLMGMPLDIRTSAFDFFLELGLLEDPVVMEREAFFEAEALAYRDRLTGLFNYAYFEQQLRIEVARARRHEAPLCLILLDLDHFKEVNDRLGHSAGNDVLKDVAEVLRRGTRSGDVVARLGGDEFAIVVHQSDERAGLMIAERKRREIEERFLDAEPRVTASVGLSMLQTPGSAAASLFDDADRALYQAKEHGRNRVFLSLAGWGLGIADPPMRNYRRQRSLAN